MNMKLVARLLDLSSETEEKIFANSEGALISGIVPRTSFFVLLTGASDKGTIQRWNTQGESGGWEVVKQWNIPKVVIDEAKTMAEVLEKGKKPPSGELDIVLGSEIVGI